MPRHKIPWIEPAQSPIAAILRLQVDQVFTQAAAAKFRIIKRADPLRAVLAGIEIGTGYQLIAPVQTRFMGPEMIFLADPKTVQQVVYGFGWLKVHRCAIARPQSLLLRTGRCRPQNQPQVSVALPQSLKGFSAIESR